MGYSYFLTWQGDEPVCRQKDGLRDNKSSQLAAGYMLDGHTHTTILIWLNRTGNPKTRIQVNILLHSVLTYQEKNIIF